MELNGHTLRSSDGKSTPGKEKYCRSDWIGISLSSFMSLEVIEAISQLLQPAVPAC